MDWNHPGESRTSRDETNGLVPAREAEKQEQLRVSTEDTDSPVEWTQVLCVWLSGDLRPGPADGSSFSLHTQPLGSPSPTQAQTRTECKASRTFLPPFTVNPGEGVLCQRMTNHSKPAGLCERATTQKWRVASVQSSSGLCSPLTWIQAGDGNENKMWNWNDRENNRHFRSRTALHSFGEIICVRPGRKFSLPPWRCSTHSSRSS